VLSLYDFLSASSPRGGGGVEVEGWKGKLTVVGLGRTGAFEGCHLDRVCVEEPEGTGCA
jgi:hypothetical protein